MAKTRAKTPRKRPASKRRASAGKPFLAGFLYGALVGVAATLALIYLPDFAPVDFPVASSDPDASSAPTVDFEFMYRLPNERMVTNVAPLAAPSDPAPPPVAPQDDPTLEYLLQAAAFRGRDQADAMRARVMLATNVKTQIESNRDPSGGTLHRVIVGPFEDRAEMQRALATLQGMDVSAMPLERPKG